MNLPMVFIYKFCKKKSNHQKRSTTKKVWATQIFIRGKLSGRVDRLWRIFFKCKKIKITSQDRKNVVLDKFIWKSKKKMYFLGLVISILIEMRKTIATLPVILSFMNFFVAQTSITKFYKEGRNPNLMRYHLIW